MTNRKARLVYATNGKLLPAGRHYDIFIEKDGTVRVQTDRTEGDAADWTEVLVVFAEPAPEPEPEAEAPKTEETEPAPETETEIEPEPEPETGPETEIEPEPETEETENRAPRAQDQSLEYK